METFFRKYFWSVNVVFVVMTALVAALIVNLFIESALAPRPANGPTRVAARTAAVEPEALLTVEKMSKLTGLPLPPPPVETSTDVYDPDAAPVKSSLRVKLLGTLVSSRPEWSVASVLDTGANPPKSGTFMVGEKVQNAEVLEIERNRVIVKNNGRREYIDNEAGDGSMVAVAPPTPSSRGGDSADGIREIGENQVEVKRTVIDSALQNLNDLAMQARIVPAFKDGVSQGFKLFSIRPDSLYSKIGIVNGDVIKRINGFEMNDPAKALEVYNKLQNASRIDIELERNGATVRKTYNITR